MDVLKRLDRLQQTRSSDQYKIMKLIDAGVFYDEISEEEKDAYCEYRRFDRHVMEQVHTLVVGDLHFVLERRPVPEPLEKIQAEIAELLESE